MTNNHYYKDVLHLQYIDIYRICKLYDITDPCLQHAIKKLLCTGNRSGSKSFEQDINDVIDTLSRMLQMLEEDNNVYNTEQAEGSQSGMRKGLASSTVSPEQRYSGQRDIELQGNFTSSGINGCNKMFISST